MLAVKLKRKSMSTRSRRKQNLQNLNPRFVSYLHTALRNLGWCPLTHNSTLGSTQGPRKRQLKKSRRSWRKLKRPRGRKAPKSSRNYWKLSRTLSRNRIVTLLSLLFEPLYVLNIRLAWTRTREHTSSPQSTIYFFKNILNSTTLPQLSSTISLPFLWNMKIAVRSLIHLVKRIIPGAHIHIHIHASQRLSVKAVNSVQLGEQN